MTVLFLGMTGGVFPGKSIPEADSAKKTEDGAVEAEVLAEEPREEYQNRNRGNCTDERPHDEK